ncbi:MAG: hypothetical protein M3552_16090 [Planctomycetota bacterium]|nr:hypothetical protein [Planctomycetaceae bacterium]MDQ3332147.1 hypothetical protein [Planctomycetota bacterium]
MNLRAVAACGIGLAVLSITVMPQQAQARPQYRGAFGKKYENLKELIDEKKCFVCHPKGDDKKVNNDYGDALKKALGEKNVKPPEKLDEALSKIEKEPSKVPKEPGGKDMKTFGELIKEGKLPGTNEEEKK